MKDDRCRMSRSDRIDCWCRRSSASISGETGKVVTSNTNSGHANSRGSSSTNSNSEQ